MANASACPICGVWTWRVDHLTASIHLLIRPRDQRVPAVTWSRFQATFSTVQMPCKCASHFGFLTPSNLPLPERLLGHVLRRVHQLRLVDELDIHRCRSLGVPRRLRYGFTGVPVLGSSEDFASFRFFYNPGFAGRRNAAAETW
jgi:hypothetical protein